MTKNPIVEVMLGIEGIFQVGIIKDMDGKRFLAVRRKPGMAKGVLVGDDELRARVFERLLLTTHPSFKDTE